MLFCPVNNSLSHPWYQNRLSQCFLDTVTTSVTSGLLILMAAIQIVFYRKWSIACPPPPTYIRPKSIFYTMQIFFSVLLMSVQIVRVFCQAYPDGSHNSAGLLGYQLFVFLFSLSDTAISLVLLILFERRRILPSFPSRSHGLPLLVFWTLSFVCEILPLFGLINKPSNNASSSSTHLKAGAATTHNTNAGGVASWWWWWEFTSSPRDQLEFSFWTVRFASSAMLFLLGIKAPGLPRPARTHSTGAANLYTRIEDEADAADPAALQQQRERQSRLRGLRNLIDKLGVVVRSVWPRDSLVLQFNVIVCLLLLVAIRVLNVFTPIYYKYIVDSLTMSSPLPPPTPHPHINASSSLLHAASSPHLLSQLDRYANAQQFVQQASSSWPTMIAQRLNLAAVNVDAISSNAGGGGVAASAGATLLHRLVYRWDLIVVYCVFRFLLGVGMTNSGLLSAIRGMLWIRVSQYASRTIAVNLFAHLHALSLSWHLSKKTGEVLRIIDRGTTSIQDFLSYILFQIAPTIVDIIIGTVVLGNAFNVYISLITLVTMIVYMAVSISVTEWRTKFRRQMNVKDNERNAKAVDSLLNFETVKYYGAERYEVARYRDTIREYQRAEYISNATLYLLNLSQGLIINAGFASGALLCAYYVVNEPQRYTVGDFVLFCTYINQLYMPLNFFGTYYRMIQQNFIDMENMLELLRVNREVDDAPNATKLVIREGQIEFRDVHFSYHPDKEILKGISFTVLPGQTFALVGHSGSGKSTIIRLLFRFYDVASGSILIDGQELAMVTQESLRQSIGVVPQDTVLFNTDIRFNIRYGRVTATDKEVEEAAEAADIHERIQRMPDRYETVVGERGLKLSGGEKQRVAIARTLLKAPRIVLLDEATSALDTKTEQAIQASLNRVCAGRTTLVVAHRLSTIIGADQILVMSEGEIVERGTHAQLIAQPDSLYADLWRSQQQSHVNQQRQQQQEQSGEAQTQENLINV